ncbi:APC family permease [Erythrobacter sp. MTPC3]|uniref:APC family permease n=1 Tax=Erythrobacter sp. MTPC3 TaxID=3056564 RepID=UPI0036F1D3B2
MKPPRVVGMAGTIVVSINGVIGSGIFALPAFLFAAAGSFSPIAILIFACLYGSALAIIAKLSTVFRQSGGAQLYAEHAFGPAVGFQVGWLSLVANMSGAAANFHVLLSYLAAIFPFFADPAIRLATIAILIAAFTGLSISGTARSVGAVAVGTVLKLAPILLLVLIGFAQNGVPTEVSLPAFSELESIALLLAFAFSGCDIAVYAAGEVKNPRKTIMRSMFLTLGGVAVFYVLVQWAYIAAAPDASALDIPLAALGEEVLGPTGSLMVSLAAIFSIATLQINIFVAVPRLIYGMARRGLLPHVFAFVSQRFKTPAVAIGAYGGVIAALSLSGTFEILATLLVSAEQIGFLAVIAAFVTMWKRDDAGLRAATDARWAVIVVVATGYIGWLLSQLSLEDVWRAAGMLAVGLALFFLAKRGAVKQDGIDLPESREQGA